jgi:uncharacterized membrane protein
MSRTTRFAVVAALGVVAGSMLATPAAAQISANANVNAVAQIVGIAGLTASGVNDLDFGSTNAGTPKSPTTLATDAARFAISGEPSYPVNITFTLPTVLTGPGLATIPVSFGGADGLLWTAYPTTFTTFNPNSVFATSLDALGNLIIGLSGTVNPPLGTTTGVYTGTITLTVAY